jgi:hypothetical protein
MGREYRQRLLPVERTTAMKVFLILAVLISASAAGFAQSDPYSTHEKSQKIKIKGDILVAKDKSKPVRRALEEQYAKIAQANINKDLRALLALRTSDFSVKRPNGEVWSYEQMADYSRRALEEVQSTISLTNDIETITLNGNEAAAVVHQQWSRMQMKKGKLRRVDTSAIQRETWVLTPDGWRLKLVDDIHPGAWYVDGKRVDPSKPYDPDAPPFVPNSEKPE